MFMFALWYYSFLAFHSSLALRIIQNSQGWERSVAKNLSVTALQSKTNDSSTNSLAYNPNRAGINASTAILIV